MARLTMQDLTMKISLKILLVWLWISGVLCIEFTQYQKFPGFACDTTVGNPTSGLRVTRCLAETHYNQCGAAQTKPDCVCCQTIKPDNTSFVYAPADRKQGERCLEDVQCPGTKCLYGICLPNYCPTSLSDWKLDANNGKSYFFSGLFGYKIEKNWTDAENFCAACRVGAHLASIHNTTELNYILDKIGVTSYWIGGTDQAVDGTWAWSDGTPFDFTDWNNSGPDGRTGEDCMGINDHRPTNKAMGDWECGSVNHFICKTDA